MKNLSKLCCALLLVLSNTITAQPAPLQYRTMQLQFAQWLKVEQQPVSGFTATHSRRLLAEKSIISGGEFQLQNSSNNCVSYAPHRFFDKYTYDIAEAIFTAHCRVFIANTLHRNSTDKNKTKIDLGKYRYSATNAFLAAYANTVDKFAIYQIHGFNSKKRNSLAGQKADVILSQGLTAPSSTLVNMSECFKSKLQLNSVLYPTQVKELGATKNILNTMAPVNSTFYHIELSYPTRKRLVTDPNFMSKFSQCVTL